MFSFYFSVNLVDAVKLINVKLMHLGIDAYGIQGGRKN